MTQATLVSVSGRLCPRAVRVRCPPAWHTHPKGQTLYVTDGIGYVAGRGGQVQEIRPGDLVYIEPNEEHWHGATPDRFMAQSPSRKQTTRARS